MVPIAVLVPLLAQQNVELTNRYMFISTYSSLWCLDGKAFDWILCCKGSAHNLDSPVHLYETSTGRWRGLSKNVRVFVARTAKLQHRSAHLHTRVLEQLHGIGEEGSRRKRTTLLAKVRERWLWFIVLRLRRSPMPSPEILRLRTFKYYHTYPSTKVSFSPVSRNPPCSVFGRSS